MYNQEEEEQAMSMSSHSLSVSTQQQQQQMLLGFPSYSSFDPPTHHNNHNASSSPVTSFPPAPPLLTAHHRHDHQHQAMRLPSHPSTLISAAAVDDDGCNYHHHLLPKHIIRSSPSEDIFGTTDSSQLLSLHTSGSSTSNNHWGPWSSDISDANDQCPSAVAVNGMIKNSGGGGSGDHHQSHCFNKNQYPNNNYNYNHHHHGVGTPMKLKLMKKIKAGGGNRRKVREPRFCFKTMSDVDVLDDGYKWRKYGQKVVKNTLHPRSYYRCTRDNCRVKKRVERLAEDPRMVITTYEGRHAHSPSHDLDSDSHSPSATSHLNHIFW